MLSTVIIASKLNRTQKGIHSKIRKPKPKHFLAVDDENEKFSEFSSKREIQETAYAFRQKSLFDIRTLSYGSTGVIYNGERAIHLY